MTRLATTTRHPRDCRGFGLIELLATVAIISILAAMAFTSFDRRREDINISVRRINADLRWARSRAIVSGDHFRFHRTGDHSYQIEHLEEIAGIWQLKSVVLSTKLPSHIALITDGVDEIDVDSRGLVVFADPDDAAPATWTVVDSRFAATRTLTLYPSGQIHAEG